MRGKVIEWDLSRTDYKGWEFIGSYGNGKGAVMDFAKGRVMVSLKTFDIAPGSESFQRGISKLVEHIKAMAQPFVNMSNQPITTKILDIRVATEAEKTAVEAALTSTAKDEKIILRVTVYP